MTAIEKYWELYASFYQQSIDAGLSHDDAVADSDMLACDIVFNEYGENLSDFCHTSY